MGNLWKVFRAYVVLFDPALGYIPVPPPHFAWVD